jgi:hypothetical protein
VHDILLKGFPQADVSFEIVWVDMLPFDGEAAAHNAAARLIGEDPRVRHFFDPKVRSGEAISATLGWDSVAWDIYLFFPPGSEWKDRPPQPAGFVHQLGSHAADGNFHTGRALEAQLRAEMERIMKEGSRTPGEASEPESSGDGG